MRWKASLAYDAFELAAVGNSEVAITPSAIFTEGIVYVFLPFVILKSRYNSELAISGT